MFSGVLTPKFYLVFVYASLTILQLSNLQKENHRLRNDLDREISSRQTMELQVESKEQTISSLKSQLEAKRHLLIENSSPLKDFDKPVSRHCSPPTSSLPPVILNEWKYHPQSFILKMITWVHIIKTNFRVHARQSSRFLWHTYQDFVYFVSVRKVEKSFVINHDSITDRAQLVSNPQSASLAPLVP